VRLPRSLRAALVVALLALGAAACGSGGGGHAASGKVISLSIATRSGLGSYLVAGGRTLYLYPPDRQRAVTCTKVGDCVSAWPPLFLKAGGTVVPGAGVDKALIGSLPGDGGRVVTYNHWPLYYYLGDRKTGEVNGQDQGFNWFVIDPKGAPIKTGPLS
jgi:predicted lipoprotein with Yx(FWY)xxD motif